MPLGPEDYTLTGKTLTGGTISGATITGGSITGMTDVALADGGTGASLVDPNADQIMFWDDSAGATAYLTASTGLNITTTNVVSCPKGHLWGMTLSNDGANTVTVAAGECTDDTGVDKMVLSGAIAKLMTGTFVVGTGQGGLNTGAEANSTWYEVHVIKRVDTGVVDVMISTTANRATFPANYTLKRRIGWIRNSGAGALLPCTQIDDHFTLTTQINDASTTPTTSAAALTMTAPPNSICRFRAACSCTALTAAAETVISLSEIVEGNVTPASTTAIASLMMIEGDATGTANDSGQAGHFELRVSATSTIEWDAVIGAGSAGETFDVSTFGWIDHREKMSAT